MSEGLCHINNRISVYKFQCTEHFAVCKHAEGEINCQAEKTVTIDKDVYLKKTAGSKNVRDIQG